MQLFVTANGPIALVTLMFFAHYSFQFLQQFKEEVSHVLDDATYSNMLEEIMDPFANKRCYIIFKNYLSIDIIHVSIPLIVQNIVPKVEVDETDKSYKITGWISSQTSGKLWNYERLSTNTTPACHSSYFLQESLQEVSEQLQPCISINLKEWNLAGRPGNCKIMIDFLLPSYVTADANYYYPWSQFSSSSWEPPFPQIDILFPIMQYNASREHFYEMWWAVLKEPERTSSRSDPRIRLNYVVYTNHQARKQSHFDIRKVELDWYAEVLYFEKVSISTWGSYKAIRFKNIAPGSTPEPQIWRTWSIRNDENSLDTKPMGLFECNLDLSHNTRKTGASAIEERNYKMQTAHIHIVQLMMENFTCIPEDAGLCKYPGMLDIDPGMSTSTGDIYMFPFDVSKNMSLVPTVILNNSVYGFRFVVCADRGRDHFQFHQLTSAFDLNVWLCLLCALVLVIVVLSHLPRTSAMKTFIEIYKVFLEQGDPFSPQTVKLGRDQFILIGVLITGMVISNGYKNVNVYKMTQPRVSLKYQRVDELVKNKFQLYSRVALAAYEMNAQAGTNNTEVPSILWVIPHSCGANVEFMTFDTTLLAYNIRITYNLEIPHDPDIQRRGNFPEITIEAHDRTNDMLIESLGQPVEPIWSSSLVRKTFSTAEQQQLLLELSKCDRAALFLPETVAVNYKTIFQQSGFGRLDVSTQKLHKPPTGISFGGLMKRSTRERVLALQQSGIILRWEKIYVFDLNKQASLEHDDVSPAELYGNIFVIFVLFFIGTCLAIILFSIEIVKLTWQI